MENFLIKTDELKEPIKIGQEYLVPCILKHRTRDKIEAEWVNGEYEQKVVEIYNWIEVFPVLNNLHSDKESGQDYKHYHVDNRFFPPNKYSYRKQNRLYNNHFFTKEPRCDFKNGEVIPKIQYLNLRCFNTEITYITVSQVVNNLKFKHKCAKNMKCLHRGTSLEGLRDRNGIITCPLHGLKYRKENMELIR